MCFCGIRMASLHIKKSLCLSNIKMCQMCGGNFHAFQAHTDPFLLEECRKEAFQPPPPPQFGPELSHGATVGPIAKIMLLK